MTLTQLQSLARNLAFERAGEVGLVTDPELIEILNVASRAIYFRIVTLAPDELSERLTVGAATNPIPFATIAPSGQPILDVLALRYGTNKLPLPRLARPADVIAFEPAFGTPTPQRWFVEESTVHLVPYYNYPSFSAEFTVVRTPADMAAGSDVPWGGKLPEHHDKIAILGSKLIYHKDENPQTPWDAFWQYLDGLVASLFGGDK